MSANNDIGLAVATALSAFPILARRVSELVINAFAIAALDAGGSHSSGVPLLPYTSVRSSVYALSMHVLTKRGVAQLSTRILQRWRGRTLY